MSLVAVEYSHHDSRHLRHGGSKLCPLRECRHASLSFGLRRCVTAVQARQGQRRRPVHRRRPCREFPGASAGVPAAGALRDQLEPDFLLELQPGHEIANHGTAFA